MTFLKTALQHGRRVPDRRYIFGAAGHPLAVR